MGNLIKHAKKELEIAGLFNEENDFYKGMTAKAVLQLIRCFEKQGHSGMSAPLVLDIFSKLAGFKPISPIMCTDDEWSNISDTTYQNIRLSSVFKVGKDGKPYYLDAIVWEEENGSCFTGTVDGITSRQFIKLPFNPETFYIKVSKDRKILEPEKLEEVFKYYERFE